MKKLYKILALVLVVVLILPTVFACANPEQPVTNSGTADPYAKVAASGEQVATSEGDTTPVVKNEALASASADSDIDPLVADALDTKHELRFNEDGNFKILIFSDVQENYPILDETIAYISRYLDEEKPDLVLFTGDNHSGFKGTKQDMVKYLTQFAQPMEERKIPWAQVYGNHVEGAYTVDNGISKEVQQEIFESFAYNLSKAGSVSGVGNYVLPILRSDSDEIAYNVFCLDSHDYLYKYEGEHPYKDGFELEEHALPAELYSGAVYDPIHFDQIAWYWDTSVALEAYNGKETPIPAMMLFHIPLWEMSYIGLNQEQTGFEGIKGESIQSPEINSGLFWAAYERGDVKNIINGHCHANDFQGEYMGITMAFAGTITGHSYGNNGPTKGVRVVTINQDDAYNADTYMLHVADLDAND